MNLAQWNPFQSSDLQNCKVIINLYCLEPLICYMPQISTPSSLGGFPHLIYRREKQPPEYATVFYQIYYNLLQHQK